MQPRDRATRFFRGAFGSEPRGLVRAPGRVNVIGEHTDYNDGFVLPVAVDRELWIALAPREDGTVEARSEESADPVRFALDSFDFDHRLRGWGLYVQGVAWALHEAGHPLAGWRGVVASDIPVGGGLSSSAAIELATARAFQVAAELDWEPMEMAQVAHRAENEWADVSSGVMDQIACARGEAGHALLIDCRSLEVSAVAMPGDARLVVLDTGTRRELGDSAYGARRKECEAAAAALGAEALRDVTVDGLRRRANRLDRLLLRRARHVVTENDRTLAAAKAMAAGDASHLGSLMDASHASLRDDFEASSGALDAIVTAARSLDGCHGARLTGGGFAGCAVALVAASAVDGFAAALPARYRTVTGLDAAVHVCRATDGASIVEPWPEPDPDRAAGGRGPAA